MEAIQEKTGNLPNCYSSIFSCAEIAGEEIEHFKQVYPDKEDVLQNAFSILQPSTEMYEIDHAIYRHHCRELLTRIAIGASKEKMSLGTTGEVLVMLHRSSLKVVLDTDFSLLFMRIFMQILPDHPVSDSLQEDNRLRYETFPGAMDQCEIQCRTRLKRDRYA